MQDPSPLALHPDRLLPADPGRARSARQLYERGARPADPVAARACRRPAAGRRRALPRPGLAARDARPLRDAAAARERRPARRARGRRSGPTEARARAVWRLLCAHWHVYRGTPVALLARASWPTSSASTLRPSAETADAIYDQIAERLAEDAFRPRALFDRFGIEVLATTDDPCDDLAAHAALAADPTSRPGGADLPAGPLPRAGAARLGGDVGRLGAVSGVDTGDYAGWVARDGEPPRVLPSRTARCRPTTATRTSGTEPLDRRGGGAHLPRGAAGTVDRPTTVALRRHMLLEMARMSCDDGLVMTLHPGVRRNHHRPDARARFGPDTGHDIPLRGRVHRSRCARCWSGSARTRTCTSCCSRSTRRCSRASSRRWPASTRRSTSARRGGSSTRRRRCGGSARAVTETAGFSRTSGFIDDTRAFCSIPARHDMSRRLDAGYLAGLVAEHRLDEDEARETIVDLVAGRPREVFKL